MLQISHGSTTTNYVYGRERLFAEQNGVRSWYANDALGSARVSLDAAGVPSEPASYDPWGKGGSATFGFTGEFQDTTDLVYLRARWYDPRSATFISRDPFEGYAEQPYSTHPYQYGYANPVVNTDPSGQAVQLPPMDGGCPAGSFWDAALARCVSPASSPERRYDDPFKAMLGDHEPCGPPNIMVVTQVYDDPAHPGSVSYKTECLPAGFVPQPPSGKTIIQGWTIDPNTGIAKPFCAISDEEEDNSNQNANNDPVPGLVDKDKRKPYLYIRKWWLSGHYVKVYDGIPSKYDPWGAVIHFRQDGSIKQIGLYDGKGNIIVHIDRPDAVTRNWHFHEMNIPGNPRTGHGPDYDHPQIADLDTFLKSLGFPDDWMTPP